MLSLNVKKTLMF